VLVQGTFFIPLAKRLDLVGSEETVLKTFTDYSGEIHTDLLEIKIPVGSEIANKTIMELDIPTDILIVMIRRNGNIITPKGNTVINEGDIMMLAGDSEEQLRSINEKAKSFSKQ